MLMNVNPILAVTVELAQMLSMDLHANVRLGLLVTTVERVSLSPDM